jgi:hypothetical protein
MAETEPGTEPGTEKGTEPGRRPGRDLAAEFAERPDPETRLSRTDAAVLAGVSRITLERALSAGDLVADGRKGLALKSVAAWLRSREVSARGGDDGSMKARKLAAEARIKELELEALEGTLVPAEGVEETWGGMMNALTNAVMEVPGAAVQSDLVDAADEFALEDLLRVALGGTSQGANGETTRALAVRVTLSVAEVKRLAAGPRSAWPWKGGDSDELTRKGMIAAAVNDGDGLVIYEDGTTRGLLVHREFGAPRIPIEVT